MQVNISNMQRITFKCEWQRCKTKTETIEDNHYISQKIHKTLMKVIKTIWMKETNTRTIIHNVTCTMKTLD